MGSIRRFFERVLRSRSEDPVREVPRTQLAAAIILVETMRADFESKNVERARILESIRELFDLSDEESEHILQLAEEKAEQKHSLHPFTKLINDEFGHDEKLLLLQQMWRVAYADGIKDKYEEQIVRRVAGLLHLSHEDFVNTRQAVADAANADAS